MDTLVLLALALAAGYIVACAWWPYTRHGWCSGTGKRRSPSGKSWRDCGGCAGSGKRVRVGRRVYEAVRGFNGD